MKNVQTRRCEMLVRVRDFGVAHKSAFPKSTAGGQAFGLVAEAVDSLAAHAVSKMSVVLEAKSAKGRARDALVTQLDVIARAAKAIAQDTPGFADPFGLSKKGRTEPALLTVGRLFVQHAEEHKAAFVSLGLPKTFVGDLSTAVEAFEQAIAGSDTAKGARKAAKAGTETALASALAAVVKLDVIVRIAYADDPQTLALWKEARRVTSAPRRRAVASASPVAAPPSPVAAPAAAAPSQPAPASTGSTPTASAPAASGSPGETGAPVTDAVLVGAGS